MPIQWNDSSQLQLFLTILETHDVKVTNWEKVAEKMNANGLDISKEACRQQFWKLKKKNASASAPSTPGGPPSTGGKRKRTKNVDLDGDDDLEFPQTPTKSVKREKKPKEKKEEDCDFLGKSDLSDAQVFKIEDDEAVVFDLDNDNFYQAGR